MIISLDTQLSYVETRTRPQLGNRLAGALSVSSKIWGRSAGCRVRRMFTQRGSTLQRKSEFRFEDKPGARHSQVGESMVIVLGEGEGGREAFLEDKYVGGWVEKET